MKYFEHKPRWVAILSAVWLLVACPGKDSPPPSPPPQQPPPAVVPTPPPPPCPTCMPNSALGPLLAAGVGRHLKFGSQESLQVDLRFYQASAGGNPMGVQYYNGIVAAEGTFWVNATASSGSCVLPPGTYQVRTISPATWQAYSFWNLRLSATGPATVELMFPNNFIRSAVPPVIGADGNAYPFHVQNDMLVERVNGQPPCAGGFPLIYVLE